MKSRLEGLNFLGILVGFAFVGMILFSKVVEVIMLYNIQFVMAFIIGLIIPGFFNIIQKNKSVKKTNFDYILFILGFLIKNSLVFSKPISKVCFSCSVKTGSFFSEENIFLKKLITFVYSLICLFVDLSIC